MRFIIINNLNHALYWSKVLGWVGRHSCDVLTEGEATGFPLPTNGRWRRIGLENGAV